MWSEDDVDQVQQAAERVIGEPMPAADRDMLRRMLQACMTRAVELAAARGGKLSDDEVAVAMDGVLDIDHAATAAHAADLFRHIQALGARNALLEARLPAGMKDCTILLKRCEVGHHQLTAMNWVAHGCSTCELDALRAELARLKPSGQVAEEMWLTDAQVESMFKALGGENTRAWSDTQRWCSTEVGPLILHARDLRLRLAAGPQEAEALRARVKELVAEVNRFKGETERLRRGGELLAAGFEFGKEQGAEAMRAACWEAIRAECEKYGYRGTMVEAAFKAAIEGAAP